MSQTEPALHYVCTWEEAASLVSSRDQFWVSNCGCRVSRGACGRSRTDVCLQFLERTAADPSGLHPITRAQVEEILCEAREHRLVARPFRGWEDRTATEGICFCCDDCCGYFLNKEERCDKGRFIERTNVSECNDCGGCVDVCHFGARAIVGGRLALSMEECYGCGTCAASCPLDCIGMVERV